MSEPVSGPAESTTTRSESEIASSRSWVMKITLLRFTLQSSSSSFSMSWRVWMSSAENGSSMSRIGGSRISICASETRFLMPPESWCG